MKLKGLLFIAVVGILASLAFAAASALTVDAGTNQAGGADLTDCDTDGVHIGYTDTWVDNHGFLKTMVFIKGIAARCFGHDHTLIIVLTDQNHHAIFTSTQSMSTGNPNVNLGAGTISVPISPGIDATLVEDAHVSISTNQN